MILVVGYFHPKMGALDHCWALGHAVLVFFFLLGGRGQWLP